MQFPERGAFNKRRGEHRQFHGLHALADMPSCWGLHLSALRLALIDRFGLRLGETIQAIRLTLGDPGLTFRETGSR
jgi:hypothetical protein